MDKFYIAQEKLAGIIRRATKAGHKVEARNAYDHEGVGSAVVTNHRTMSRVIHHAENDGSVSRQDYK